MCRTALAGVFAFAMGSGLWAQEPTDRFYRAIRNNDMASLRDLVKNSDVNMKDQRGSTPLMYTAAFGSVDAMKALLDAGADVNAKNAFDATALLWCANDMAKTRLLLAKGADVNARSKQGRSALLVAASYSGAYESVKFLLEKGADIAVHDVNGYTALLAAADANDINTVRLLLEKGVDVNAKGAFNSGGLPGLTAVITAASHGNVEMIKLLLAKGSDVNFTGDPSSLRVKNGPIGLGLMTPLLAAASYGGPEAVKLLLDAGAKVNFQDARGMTPLMLAIATDRPDVRVIRLLIDKGADPSIKSNLGESSTDWAKKFSNPEVLKLLGSERAQAAVPVIQPAADRKPGNPREAAAKSIALLQRTSVNFFKEGGCVACHAQNLTGMAVTVARSNGVAVDEAAVAEQSKVLKLQFTAFDQILLQRVDVPGAVDLLAYSVLQLATEGAPADRVIDAIVFNIAGQQRAEGNWHIPGVARPPLEDGDFARTALSIRACVAYGFGGRKAEFDQRIARAAAWLKAADPRTTEDRNMQLLGLKWANTDRRTLEERVKQLLALQHSDGGWAQTPELASDAYGTGQTLYTLHEMGIPPSNAAYQRGVEYLLRTQLDDGSWHVASRSPRFQPYFQSGFPHDHDQWISSAATGWSAMALCYAASAKPLTASLHQ